MFRSLLICLATALAGLVLATTASATSPLRSAIAPGVFRSDDGGAVYVRAVGNDRLCLRRASREGLRVRAAGHADRATASRVSGGTFPSTARSTRGTIELQVSQNGDPANAEERGHGDRRIRADAHRPGRACPGRRPTARRGSSRRAATTSTGSGSATDGRRTYLREIGSSVVGVTRAQAGTNTSARLGDRLHRYARGRAARVTGTYADVPKGRGSRTAALGFALVSGTRRLAVAQTGTLVGGSRSPTTRSTSPAWARC